MFQTKGGGEWSNVVSVSYAYTSDGRHRIEVLYGILFYTSSQCCSDDIIWAKRVAISMVVLYSNSTTLCCSLKPNRERCAEYHQVFMGQLLLSSGGDYRGE